MSRPISKALRLVVPVIWWVAADIFVMQSTYGASPNRSALPNNPYPVSDATPGWAASENYKLAIEAVLKCDQENDCFLVIPPDIRLSFAANFTILKVLNIQFFQSMCRDNLCYATLTGRSLDAGIMAYSYSLQAEVESDTSRVPY
jgi:hypothetical protein